MFSKDERKLFLNDSDPAIIIEFKAFNSRYEKTLEDTVQRALKQIEDNHYDQILLDKKIPKEKIKKYGFGFRGKHVLIGKG